MAKKKHKQSKKAIQQDDAPTVRVETESSIAMENLRKIDEVESHKLIYEPLLQRIGFQHVTYCHGQFERGKDFICLDRNRLGGVRSQKAVTHRRAQV